MAHWRDSIGCDGSYACGASRHIEGCFTGDGHPDAIRQGEIDRLREALTEAEATLKHIQPYAGLLVQYLPESTRRVAAAREKANAALSPAARDSHLTGEDR
jgi:hypothetical protein